MSDTVPELNERILSTLNTDGSRRWMTPRLVKGALWKRRLVVAWILMIVFNLLPWLRMNGKPVILLDIAARQFTFFGTTFRPFDTLLLALFVLSAFIAIFLLTAIVGRVWCGWGCPQTVYMEFLYRPIEQFFKGKAYGKKNVPFPVWKRLAMYAVFAVLSAHLANTFIAYFVGTDNLVGWTLHSPFAHPTAFAVFAVVTGLMLFDFCFFREQMCTLVCPYGRFQSVLLDRDSVIVGYDEKRGEPRGRKKRTPKTRAKKAGCTCGDACGSGRGGCHDGDVATATPMMPTVSAPPKAETVAEPEIGDCVDCTMCVQVCPTGIDIREGLQLECINCTQCIDACNSVMEKLGRDPGLIRLGSQNGFDGVPTRRVRVRTIIYPLILLVVVGALVTLLVTRASADVVQLRAKGVPYVMQDDGTVRNLLELRIDNRGETPRTYTFEIPDVASLRGGEQQLVVEGGTSAIAQFEIFSTRESFERGRRTVEVRVTDSVDFDRTVDCTLMGPFGSSID